MRSSAPTLIRLALLGSPTAAAELDPLAVTVDVSTADPATAEAIRKCGIARAEQKVRDDARTAQQRATEELAGVECRREHGADKAACDRQSPPDPACQAADQYTRTMNTAYARAVQARDDCIKADPVAFAGYVNLRNHTLVTTEQMTAVRRCVARASQQKP